MDSKNQSRHRYIKELEIINFQSHAHTKFEFHPGINFVTGTTNHGKSAALRAINWVLYNDPSGDEFIRKNETQATVKITYNDDVVVSRVKDRKDLNQYIINAPGWLEPIIKNKVGSLVPEEAQKAMGFPPKDTFHGSLAYVDQMSSLFFVSLSETDLPRCISQLIGISSFGEAAENLFSEQRDLTKALKTTTQKVGSLQVELKKFEHLEEERYRLNYIASLLEESELISDQLDLTNQYIDSYSNILSLGQQAIAAIQVADKVLKHEEELNIILDCKKQYELATKYKEDIIKISKEERLITQECEKLDVIISAYSDDDAEAIEDIKNKLLLVQNSIQSLKSMKDIYDKVTQEINQYDNTIELLETELQQVKDEIEQSGLICPTCEQEVHFA